jgi:drug/metabolite transporter (DMT)-like permease
MTLQMMAALAASAGLAAFGQIMLKLGATGRTGILELCNLHVFAGLGLYALGVLIWLYALSKLPLFVVYPFTLLTLGLVFVSSIVVLGERPSTFAVAGWLVIAAGLVLVALGSRGSA